MVLDAYERGGVHRAANRALVVTLYQRRALSATRGSASLQATLPARLRSRSRAKWGVFALCACAHGPRTQLASTAPQPLSFLLCRDTIGVQGPGALVGERERAKPFRTRLAANSAAPANAPIAPHGERFALAPYFLRFRVFGRYASNSSPSAST